MEWRPTPAFLELVTERSRGLFSTVICEEAINVAKNNRAKYFGQKFRKPETIMRTVLGSSLITERHHFEAVQVAPPADTVVVPR